MYVGQKTEWPAGSTCMEVIPRSKMCTCTQLCCNTALKLDGIQCMSNCTASSFTYTVHFVPYYTQARGVAREEWRQFNTSFIQTLIDVTKSIVVCRKQGGEFCLNDSYTSESLMICSIISHKSTIQVMCHDSGAFEIQQCFKMRQTIIISNSIIAL